MRLWVICLQALLFIGLLIAIGQSGLFDTIMGRNVRMGDPLFEDYQRGSIPFIDVDGRDVFVAQSHPDNPLILSGFPAYASKLFRLPTDSRPLSGTYNIAFATDAVPDAEGALRISINGVKRADVVLNQGRFKRRAKIELTPAELASGQLEVKLALVGRGPMAECTPNEALAAVVTILPGPLSSCRDKNIAEGLRTSRNPDTDIANTPISLLAPKRFLTARTIV